MASEYGTFSRGAVAFPLSTISPNPLLLDADPFRFYALEFFAYVLKTYVGARYAAAAQAAGLPLNMQGIVGGTTPIDPEPFLTTEQFGFPLLAVYRKSSELSYKTVTTRLDSERFGVTFALPPMTAGQAANVEPILHAVVEALDDRAERGWDPGYAPTNGTLGANVWRPPFSSMGKVRFTNVTYGRMEGTGNLWFFAILADLVVEELGNGTGAFPTFEGANLHADVKDHDGTTATDVAQGSTQQPPTVTSVTPASATKAGGTVITITGTLFLGPASVTIGNAPCTNVVVVSPSQITCTTAGSADPGAVDLVVTNFDGQTATLSGGFTYT